MITSMTLLNFQKHKKKKYDFENGLNLITGGNDEGKSSLIRAIYWVFYNKPNGDWMRRIDKEGGLCSTTVKIVFTDNIIIKRIKDDKKNIYEFDGEEFTKVGLNIPTPIQEYLGKLQVKFGSSTFFPNIHMHHEGAFMVNESSPTRGSLLNYFTGIEFADKAKRNITKETRTYSIKHSKCVGIIKSYQEYVDEHKGIDLLWEKVCQIKEMQEMLEVEKKLLLDIKHINNMLDENKFKLKVAKKNVEALLGVQTKVKAYLGYIATRDLAESIKTAEYEHKVALKQKDKIEALKAKYDEWCELKNLKININQVFDNIDSIKEKIDYYKSELEELIDKSKICPTCGQEWDQS